MMRNSSFLILAVETSAAPSTVALLESPAGSVGGEPAVLGVREFARGAGGVGADTPARSTETLLAAAGRRAADLGLVAVSVGPGSYTGLRIGISFAKTLAWAVGAPAVAVPSLEALTRTALAEGLVPPAEGGLLVPVCNAFRGQLYARAFGMEAAVPAAVTDDLVLTAKALAARLAGLSPAGCLLFGPGVTGHADALRTAADAAGLEISLAPGPPAPGAAEVGRLGLALFRAGKTVTPHDLVPVYLRATEAEERLAARNGKA